MTQCNVKLTHYFGACHCCIFGASLPYCYIIYYVKSLGSIIASGTIIILHTRTLYIIAMYLHS